MTCRRIGQQGPGWKHQKEKDSLLNAALLPESSWHWTLGPPRPLARVFLTLDRQPNDECSSRLCLLEGEVGACCLASKLLPMFAEFLSCEWKTVYLTAEGGRQHLSHRLSRRLEREHEPGLTNLVLVPVYILDLQTQRSRGEGGVSLSVSYGSCNLGF